MNDHSQITAQLVMRRSDGRSILDLGPITAESDDLRSGDLTPDRIAEIHQRLKGAGLTVLSGNSNTLSVTGPSEVFVTLFGIDPADSHQTPHIRADLAPYIADISIPPPPEFFP